MSVRALSDHGLAGVPVDEGPVLSYKASCLWREDVLTLLPGEWLNDNVLVWWEEHLAHEVYAARTELCLLHPGATFLFLFEHPDECVRAARARVCRRRLRRLSR